MQCQCSELFFPWRSVRAGDMSSSPWFNEWYGKDMVRLPLDGTHARTHASRFPTRCCDPAIVAAAQNFREAVACLAAPNQTLIPKD